ncbi:molybdate ABC transporter substrate-binding protein [Bradyrhizobium sp. SYSU BS000235]|uniref:molybdate ABC transporter substrate-binding protein n=1 Tax=Bradyrhizobium sp. SYSU BS000235 TaxID=3411332 RepID=UPI003C768D8D
MNTLKILSGGAAQGLVDSLAAKFRDITGYVIEGEFGAVGTMAEKLRAGRPADVLILTTAVLDALARDGFIVSGAATDVGLVEAAIAVRASDPAVAVDTADALRDSLRACDAFFVPDTKASTAGQHIAKVLSQLGIAGDMKDRLREFPNGATAMRHLASSDAARPIGCTQTTEILNTPGLTLIGPLPPGCELATMYAATPTGQTTHATAATTLIKLLTASEQHGARQRAGFLSRSGN